MVGSVASWSTVGVFCHSVLICNRCDGVHCVWVRGSSFISLILGSVFPVSLKPPGTSVHTLEPLHILSHSRATHTQTDFNLLWVHTRTQREGWGPGSERVGPGIPSTTRSGSWHRGTPVPDLKGLYLSLRGAKSIPKDPGGVSGELPGRFRPTG